MESYSHFHGLEFLMIHRPELFDDLGQLIEELDAADFGNADPNSLTPNTPDDPGRRRYRVKLQGQGWKYTNSAKLECFNKRRIGLKFYFGLRAGEQQSEFNDFCTRYRGDEIDVGVGIFPMESAERDLGTAGFETAILNLKNFGRLGTVVPLALFAVRPEMTI